MFQLRPCYCCPSAHQSTRWPPSSLGITSTCSAFQSLSIRALPTSSPKLPPAHEPSSPRLLFLLLILMFQPLSLPHSLSLVQSPSSVLPLSVSSSPSLLSRTPPLSIPPPPSWLCSGSSQPCSVSWARSVCYFLSLPWTLADASGCYLPHSYHKNLPLNLPGMLRSVYTHTTGYFCPPPPGPRAYSSQHLRYHHYYFHDNQADTLGAHTFKVFSAKTLWCN